MAFSERRNVIEMTIHAETNTTNLFISDFFKTPKINQT
jgi:hypothetical protein